MTCAQRDTGSRIPGKPSFVACKMASAPNHNCVVGGLFSGLVVSSADVSSCGGGGCDSRSGGQWWSVVVSGGQPGRPIVQRQPHNLPMNV